MRIVVCVKQSVSGELNPFDAAAYEAALRIQDAEVILLSMGPQKSAELLRSLTRLGAKRALLLSDPAFAGADTLATSYTLSLAIERLKPSLVFCGRQTVDGETGQIGPCLAKLCGFHLIANALSIVPQKEFIQCETRSNTQSAGYPALITVEKIHTLRFPSIRSHIGTVEILSALDLSADVSRCGQKGSATSVISTYTNRAEHRTCKYIDASQLQQVIANSLQKHVSIAQPYASKSKMKEVWTVGNKPRQMAEMIGNSIRVIQPSDADTIAREIQKNHPSAVLWGSDPWSKRTAPQVAAILRAGLCADCTHMETDGQTLFMFRPAFSGSMMAEVKCTVFPQMATVRTPDENAADMIVTVGSGAKQCLEFIKSFAKAYGAQLAASRPLVDEGTLPYDLQVGLTGKTVSPKVYLAVGVSGAIHHIVGMRESGTIIAVNPDQNAPFFQYADYGIVAKAEDVFL